MLMKWVMCFFVFFNESGFLLVEIDLEESDVE